MLPRRWQGKVLQRTLLPKTQVVLRGIFPDLLLGHREVRDVRDGGELLPEGQRDHRRGSVP